MVIFLVSAHTYAVIIIKEVWSEVSSGMKAEKDLMRPRWLRREITQKVSAS